MKWKKEHSHLESTRLLPRLPSTFAQRGPSEHISNPFAARNAMNSEILRSWAILFATDPNAKRRAADYDKMITTQPDFYHRNAKFQHLGLVTVREDNDWFKKTWEHTVRAALNKEEI